MMTKLYTYKKNKHMENYRNISNKEIKIIKIEKRAGYIALTVVIILLVIVNAAIYFTNGKVESYTLWIDVAIFAITLLFVKRFLGDIQ